MKRIDIGNASFVKLISSGNIYVDKTKYIHDLLTDGGTYYFCSRPRRFGKSLVLHTLQAVFEGRRELFSGLHIYETNYDWHKHPVIRMDFSMALSDMPEAFVKWLGKTIVSASEELKVCLDPSDDYKSNFEELLKKGSKLEKIVLLIDEYDKPLIESIGNPGKTERIKGVMLHSDFPNSEVRESFASKLVFAYIGAAAERRFSPYQMLL